MDERLPYPGLRAYNRDESDLFFGREGCVDDMVERLAATRFLAVLGASGSGKSSLVRTGLLDALELGLYARAGSRWIVAECSPGGQPMRGLAAALLRASDRAHADELDVSVVETFLRRGPLAVVEWCRDGNLVADSNLLVLVDQFEEIFRYSDYAGWEEAEAYVALLLESVQADAAVHVVITMRSEYLTACSLMPGLAEQINAGLYLTRRMTREECRQAIEGPAGVVGFDIEPRLVSRLLNDLSSFAPWEDDPASSQLQRLSRRADQLPLMQHVLNRLWQYARRRDTVGRPQLTLADYESIGELRGALDAHGDEIVVRLSEIAKPLVRNVFRALITGTSLSDAVRRPQRFGELVDVVGVNRAHVLEVVDAFRATDSNFLRPAHPALIDEATIIDISHESLIRQWSSCASWIVEEARAATLWQRLVNALTRYEQGEGDLLHGLDLANVLAWWERERPNAAWARGHSGDYGAVTAFLEKSRRAEQEQVQLKEEVERRERRRLRLRSAIYAALFVLASISTGVAWWNNATLKQETARAEQAANDAKAAQTVAEEAELASFIIRQQMVMERSGAGLEAAGKSMISEKFPSLSEAAAAAARALPVPDASGYVSTDKVGIAIRGYDPVAYFTHGEPMVGDTRNFAVWEGALWLFAHAKNRDLFLAEPERYAPALGGHCAYCAAINHKVHGDPYAWNIRDGRLYLHMNASLRDEWLKMPDNYIKEAEERWPSLRDTKIDPDVNSAFTDLVAQKQKIVYAP